MKRMLALVLAAALLLSGCLWLPETVHFEDMEYARPDMGQFRNLLDECTALAREGSNWRDFEDSLWGFLIWYNDYSTNYTLADIRYCQNLNDIYWTDEYNFYLETTAEVDSGMDQLLYLLADSPFREKLETDNYFGEGYFDSYTGDSFWTESFTALMEEESALIGRYYDLSARLGETAWTSGEYEAIINQMCGLYVELIAKRQEIAADAGYDDYRHFAYDFYYARDYTPEQEAEYIARIRQELVPLYRHLCQYGPAEMTVEACDEAQTLAYVREAAEAMGGTIGAAYGLMEEAGLYDIAPGVSKYDASFETYIYNYYEPFVFLNPEGSSYDKLTFAHEFGHFCSDYASCGSVAGIDVAEVFSQGMEYLSLCYAEDTALLEKLAMVNCLCVYVEQAAYASFEQQVYALTGEELTAENVSALFARVATDFGFDVLGVDSRDYAGVTHFFTNPMYVFSYVVSNDTALQLYQLERAEPGAGLRIYDENLATEEAYFLAFLESAGLESPFSPGRIESVRKTLEDILT